MFLKYCQGLWSPTLNAGLHFPGHDKNKNLTTQIVKRRLPLSICMFAVQFRGNSYYCCDINVINIFLGFYGESKTYPGWWEKATKIFRLEYSRSKYWFYIWVHIHSWFYIVNQLFLSLSKFSLNLTLDMAGWLVSDQP